MAFAGADIAPAWSQMAENSGDEAEQDERKRREKCGLYVDAPTHELIKSVFNALDADGNGSIDRSDFRVGEGTAYGNGKPGKRLGEIFSYLVDFEEMDGDGDKTIGKGEFYKFVLTFALKMPLTQHQPIQTGLTVQQVLGFARQAYINQVKEVLKVLWTLVVEVRLLTGKPESNDRDPDFFRR